MKVLELGVTSMTLDWEPFTFSSCHHNMVLILHGIISSTFEIASYESPFVSINPMSCKKPLFLFFCKWLLVNIGIKLVVPSQSATFPYNTKKKLVWKPHYLQLEQVPWEENTKTFRPVWIDGEGEKVKRCRVELVENISILPSSTPSFPFNPNRPLGGLEGKNWPDIMLLHTIFEKIKHDSWHHITWSSL